MASIHVVHGFMKQLIIRMFLFFFLYVFHFGRKSSHFKYFRFPQCQFNWQSTAIMQFTAESHLLEYGLPVYSGIFGHKKDVNAQMLDLMHLNQGRWWWLQIPSVGWVEWVMWSSGRRTCPISSVPSIMISRLSAASESWQLQPLNHLQYFSGPTLIQCCQWQSQAEWKYLYFEM